MDKNKRTTYASAVQAFSKAPVAEINRIALEHGKELFSELFPEAVFKSGEMFLGDVSGVAGNSLKFSLIDGKWADFGGPRDHRGVGLVSLYAKHLNDSVAGATALLATRLGVKGASELILPVPVENEDPNIKNREHLEKLYAYRDIDGSLLGYTMRIRLGGGAKTIKPWVYTVDKGWRSKTWTDPKPLYRMDALGRCPDAKVLVVEGEKTAERAAEVFPEPEWAVVSWPGGTKNVENVWWPALTGRVVVLWPDNDPQGRKAMSLATRLLYKAGAQSVSLVEVPSLCPPGWDLGDDVPDGVNLKYLLNSAKPRDSFTELLENYVYVVQTDQFMDVHKFTWYDSKRMRAMYMSQSKDMASELLSSPDLKIVEKPTYWPGKPLFITEDGLECINTWKNDGVEAHDGDTTLFNEHMLKLIPDEAAREHVLDYLAFMVQHPGEKIRHTLLIQGPEGAGKSYLGELMKHIIGPSNYRELDNDALTQPYTEWASSKQLVVVEEVMAVGRREISNKLKTKITSPTLEINIKGVRQYIIPNRMNFIMLTNHKDALPIDPGDRRYFVYYSPLTPQSPEYYDALFGQLPEYAPCVKKLLLTRNLSRFNPAKPPPVTEHKVEMIEDSLPPLDQRIREMVENFEPPFHTDFVTAGEVLQRVGDVGRHMSERKIGRALARLGHQNHGQKRIFKDQPQRRAFLWSVRNHDLVAEMTEGELRELYVQKGGAF